MERLTEKFYHNGFEYMATGFGSNRFYAIDKLGKLEDIEEKSGIDLLTLFKAQTQGIWYLQFQGYDENGNNVYMPVKQEHPLFIDFKQKALVGQWIGYDFEDYKKITEDGWATTEEELLELLHTSKDELLELVHSVKKKDRRTLQVNKEELLKALNIIVDRNVNTCFLVEARDLEEYNNYILKTIGTYYTLNQEQYDFLKEVIVKIQEEVDKRGILY